MPDPRPKTLSENPSSRVISKPAKLTLMRSRNAMMYSRNRNGSRRRLIRRRVRSATEADSRAGVIRNANDIRAREEKALPMIRQLSQWVGMWRKHSCLPRSHSCERLFVFNKTLGQPNSAFSVWRATAGGIRAELRRWFRSRSRRRGSASRHALFLGLLPAAAKRAIKLNHRLQFHQPQLRQRELSGKQVALRIQDLKVAIQAAAIAQVGQPHAFRKRGHQLFFLATLLARTSVNGQGVGHFAQRAIDGLLIGDQHLALLCFRELDACAEARVENREQGIGGDRLIACRSGEHARQRAALAA